MTVAGLYSQVEGLARAWPAPQGGEPNLEDLDWLARSLMARMPVTLPDLFPTLEQGVEVVEIVEAKLLAHAPSPYHRVRDISPAALVDHLKAIAQEIRHKELLSHDDATNVIGALFAWIGCIGMAKNLREVDILGRLYTDDVRRRDYARIEAQWAHTGGQWVRYGVTLARTFELDRSERSRSQRKLIEDWVPHDSPYWRSAKDDRDVR